jgi:hypothetical protein
MPNLHELTTQLVAWLRAQPLDSPIREYSLTVQLPPSAYPQLAVLPSRVRFTPNRQCAEAEVTLRLCCCAGRPADAVAEAQTLAAQLKQCVEGSGGLGGLARCVEVAEVRFKVQGAAFTGEGESPFVQVAEVDVRVVFNT